MDRMRTRFWETWMIPPRLQLAPRGTPLWHTGWFNLAPRLGAAWVARDEPGKELSFVPAVECSSTPERSRRSELSTGSASQLPLISWVRPCRRRLSQIDFSDRGDGALYATMQAFAFSPHLQLPYSWQWNHRRGTSLGQESEHHGFVCRRQLGAGCSKSSGEMSARLILILETYPTFLPA